jgi:hypothetical protein
VCMCVCVSVVPECSPPEVVEITDPLVAKTPSRTINVCLG